MRAAYLAILGLSSLLVVGCATATPAQSGGQGAAGLDTRPSSDACRGPGRYEAGKEGSYKPCCEGLHEVLTRRYDPSSHNCVDLPLRQYACVKGECWDGICEVGEQDPCGCPIDCPDSNPPAQEIDSSWIEVTTKCHFTFRAPADVTEMKAQGQDSCVTHHEAGGCILEADYGPYSGALNSTSDLPGFVPFHAVIDSMEASLVSFGPLADPLPFQAAVHFDRLPAGIGTKLTMFSRCTSEQGRDMTVQIFRTLQFER